MTNAPGWWWRCCTKRGEFHDRISIIQKRGSISITKHYSLGINLMKRRQTVLPPMYSRFTASMFFLVTSKDENSAREKWILKLILCTWIRFHRSNIIKIHKNVKWNKHHSEVVLWENAKNLQEIKSHFNSSPENRIKCSAKKLTISEKQNTFSSKVTENIYNAILPGMRYYFRVPVRR